MRGEMRTALLAKHFSKHGVVGGINVGKAHPSPKPLLRAELLLSLNICIPAVPLIRLLPPSHSHVNLTALPQDSYFGASSRRAPSPTRASKFHEIGFSSPKPP